MTSEQLAERHSCASLKAAQGEIEQAILALRAHSQPASDQEILTTISALADMLQVEVPEALGLEMYVAALRNIPRPAFTKARELLVLRHKWPRLPYPADFIEAAAEERQCLEVTMATLQLRRKLVIRARRVLRARSK